MPYDNVYSEKRTPGALRTVWRNFYGDTTAMIGFYGCIGMCHVDQKPLALNATM